MVVGLLLLLLLLAARAQRQTGQMRRVRAVPAESRELGCKRLRCQLAQRTPWKQAGQGEPLPYMYPGCIYDCMVFGCMPCFGGARVSSCSSRTRRPRFLSRGPRHHFCHHRFSTERERDRRTAPLPPIERAQTDAPTPRARRLCSSKRGVAAARSSKQEQQRRDVYSAEQDTRTRPFPVLRCREHTRPRPDFRADNGSCCCGEAEGPA